MTDWSIDPRNWPHTPPLDEFRRQYDADDNLWWRTECGHHQNLFEAACEVIDELRARYEEPDECGCWTCHDERAPATTDLGERLAYWSVMIVCETCGNKRCPHGTDHRLACTDSNEPGQPGSRY